MTIILLVQKSVSSNFMLLVILCGNLKINQVYRPLSVYRPGQISLDSEKKSLCKILTSQRLFFKITIKVFQVSFPTPFYILYSKKRQRKELKA